jgi:hypothetical protein
VANERHRAEAASRSTPGPLPSQSRILTRSARFARNTINAPHDLRENLNGSICRPEILSPDSYRLHWREVGYFRDPVTGDVAVSWLNPITGERVPALTTFEEGPSAYTITETSDRLKIELSQRHATVRSIKMILREAGDGRTNLVQQERKVRGFPLADGTMPTPESGATS